MNTSHLETNTQTIERLTREHDDAQKACAEMRRHLEVIDKYQARFWPDHGTTSMAIKRALSSDAGKGWLSPGQVKPLTDALRRCVKQCDYMPAHEGLAYAKTLACDDHENSND